MNIGKYKISRRTFLGIIGATTLASLGYFNILKAKAEDLARQVDESVYDETKEWFYGTDFAESVSVVKFLKKDIGLDEPMKIPDDITRDIKTKIDKLVKSRGEEYVINFYKEKGYIIEIKIDSCSLAGWGGSASEVVYGLYPYLVKVDTDGDGKPEELYPTAQIDLSPSGIPEEEWAKEIKDHIKYVPSNLQKKVWDIGNVMINLYWPSTPNAEKLSPLQKIIYTQNPNKIKIIDAIHYKDAIRKKTPKEIGLDVYNENIKLTTTPSPVETLQGREEETRAPSKPEPQEIPGFEIPSAVLAAGAAWKLHEKLKNK